MCISKLNKAICLVVAVFLNVITVNIKAIAAEHEGAGEKESDSSDDIGISVYVGDKSLRNYKPQTNLITDENLIDIARFPAVDVHCHWRLEEDPADLLEAMDRRNIRRAINLSGGFGQQLSRMLAKFHRYAPERLIIFCTPNFDEIDDPRFSDRMIQFIQQAHRNGVSGVKIFKSLGLTIKDQSGKIVPIDDPRLDTIWRSAGELGMPVLIHTADPVAFFKPVDRFNERWMQLNRHPNWRFHGSGFPKRQELLAQRNRVIDRHTSTKFIGAHVANSAEDLKMVSQWLDKYPNLYVDISGRVAELGRQPYTARKFFIKYQDRVLFGSDRFPGRKSQPRYSIYYRFLETQDEYFDYYDHPFPPAGEWKIYGLYLPDQVLEKIYYRNADRLLGLGH